MSMTGKRNRATYEADLQVVKSPYVFYGTPLPPLDSNVRDDGSFVPIWKQEVTDERGRKRLHGAFTGGFSAGYFNTVGSKEGWTPSTFVSSKSNRWKDGGNKAQQAEDFMDDEDKAEAEEAKQVTTKSGFASLGSTEDEVGKRAPLMDLIRSSEDTMGFKLLRKMGWKDGQGIGPRVWRTAVLDDGNVTGKNSREKHLFAPKNSNIVMIVRKDDHKGLGYGGGEALEYPKPRRTALSDDENADLNTQSRKLLTKKGAFGVGVLNDTGSDDEDPFSLGPKISYSKVLGGDKKKKKKIESKVGSNHKLRLSKAPIFMSSKAKMSLAGFRKCHDGRLPLEGFILSISKPSTEPNKYPPPKVPDGWVPSRAGKEYIENAEDWQSSADLAKLSSLEPSSRGTLLGEAPLPSKSVFDFIKPDARAKLVSLTKNESLPPAGSESGLSLPDQIDTTSIMPPLDPGIASAALGRGVGGFVPYTDNPDKLARYRAYLSYCAGISTEAPVKPVELLKDEWVRELQEFAHAATIFKPMTGSIATRFTTARATTLASKEANADDEDMLIITGSKARDPAEEAAQMGMFGHLTRSSQLFYPSRLLCKRFNVPVPVHVHSGNDGSSGVSQARHDGQENAVPITRDQTSTATFGSRFQSSGFQMADNKEPTREITSFTSTILAVPTAAHHEDVDSKKHVADVDPDRNQALEQERPGDDVFRAVFGSDSEDE